MGHKPKLHQEPDQYVKSRDIPIFHNPMVKFHNVEQSSSLEIQPWSINSYSNSNNDNGKWSNLNQNDDK